MLRFLLAARFASCRRRGAAGGRPGPLQIHTGSAGKRACDARRSRIAVMVPMRDGVRLSTNIYTPKNATGRLPVILWKTPYNEHKLRGSTQRYAIEAVRRGYVFIVQSERGRYFSEGKYEILGKPQTDGYDTLSWIAAQGWSNGKVGTLGCSSSAEWQLALAGAEPSRACGDGADGGGRRDRQGRPLSGTGQLVHRRRAAQPVLRLALWRRQSGPRPAARRYRRGDARARRRSTTTSPRPSPRSTGRKHIKSPAGRHAAVEPGRAAADLRHADRAYARRSGLARGRALS